MNGELPAVPEAAAAALSAGLQQLRLDPALAEPLGRYLQLLLLWNGTYNLTAVRDPQDIVVKHLLDCLAMLPHVHGQRLVDIGSGAGLPGLPLALACPGLSVVLVETAGKKARFLREATRVLGLRDRVEVRNERAEQVALAEPCDMLTARAFGSIAEILRVGGHLLASDGQLLAMKGREDELRGEAIPAGYRLQTVHPLQVPGLGAERHLAVVTRVH